MQSYYLDSLEPGMEFESVRRTVTESDIASFSAITGDYSPLHADQVFIEEETDLRTRIAQGWLIVTIQSGLRSQLDQWPILAYLGMERAFRAPVYPEDTIQARYRIEEVRPSQSRPDRGVVELFCEVVNQSGEVVCDGLETFMVERDPAS